MKKLFSFLLTLGPVLIFGQCLQGDCDNGIGKYKFKNGTYVGQFLNGNLSGKGTFSTRKGYVYNGEWKNGIKSGFGKEVLKKEGEYEGYFQNNLREGSGTATLKDTKYMHEIIYAGEWEGGTICGEGELYYLREVKYGRERVVERNHLVGSFINGVYQGRITSPYSDELNWEPFALKTENFQKHQVLSERELKRLKNLTTIQGEIVLSCECVSGMVIFNSTAVLRQGMSWWSGAIPVNRKKTAIRGAQGEFDIIEWHARELEVALNKQKLPCKPESINFAWGALLSANRDCNQIRKEYVSETAWNPKKRGEQKNPKPQEKWDKKIAKKLKQYSKLQAKILAKMTKRLSQKEVVSCPSATIDVDFSPIKKVVSVKEDVVVEKEEKIKRSFRPHFPRANQLE